MSSPGPDNQRSQPDSAASPLPVAEIRQVSSTMSLLRHSGLWWLTLVCAVVTVALVWLAMPAMGPRITIRFPEGHGLKTGDRLRHRGIDVGEVTTIGLSDDLTQIDVHVQLQPDAAALAREGSRFWIVRPQFSLEGVSGLETAVGAKYIGVSPGDPQGARQTLFEGLAALPPDQFEHEGLEVVLRSEQRHGLSAGAPVTWRGVDVGQVLSVGLSPDARHVDLHVRIDSEYRRLLKSNSRFWVTSGLGVDLRLTGVRLTAESLATIARGGVSFITPGETSGGADVVAGRVFRLHPELDEDWLEQAAAIPLVDVRLPPTVVLQGTRQGSLLGIRRSQSVTANGILVPVDGETRLFTASDVLEPDENNVLPAFSLSAPGTDHEQRYENQSADSVDRQPSGIAQRQLDPGPELAGSVARITIRHPQVPEECVVARSVTEGSELSSVMYAIGAERLTDRDALWYFTEDEKDLSDWHGAPVIAVSDGALIGLLVMTDGGPAVAPMAPANPKRQL